VARSPDRATAAALEPGLLARLSLFAYDDRIAQHISSLPEYVNVTEPSPANIQGRSATTYNLAVLAIAAAGTIGTLVLTWGLDLKACPLCLYQRTFVMAALGVVGVGLLTRLRDSALPIALALPAAVGGLGVAAFHEYLEFTGRLECPAGLLGLGSAPQQSLAMFVVLSAIMGVALWRGRRSAETGLPAIIAALLLGIALAAATVKSAPPPCPPDYTKDIDGCRPVQKK